MTRVDGVLEAEVDGQRILLSPKDLAYFGLSATGAATWDLIDGERDVDALVVDLRHRFDTDAAVIRRDVAAFVTGMSDAGLIRLSS